VFVLSAVDRWFDSRYGQTGDHNIDICWSSTTHAALRCRNPDTLSEWLDMSIRELSVSVT